MARGDRPAVGTGSSVPALAPPWAAGVAVTSLLAGGLLAGLVWHSTQLNPVDKWMYRWQDLAWDHANGMAESVSRTLPAGVTLIVMVAASVLAYRAGRVDAVLLALTTAPAALAAELVLKRLVHRQWNGDRALIFPSGHVAVATAAAMTAVLVLRVLPAAPRVRLAGASLGVGFVLVVAVARLVETVHTLTDVLGGSVLGLTVTLGGASAITAWFRRRPHLKASSGCLVVTDDPPAPGARQRR